ncbi:MAG: hypothetical protein H7A21_08715 [Spirochaetales bacterium]|nr:hypothetical protein [Leptospiraceae bacterium]MCP5481499.1 hypothetical protein [Spirochaetales bacterium]MCP5484328.1 hypothetical protein [Spirochaetales bacterium]
MAQFLANITILLEGFAIAGGLALLYKAGKESSGLLRAAGIVLVSFGALTLGLTLTYYSLYWLDDGFDTVHPPMQMHGRQRHGGDGPDGMQHGGMQHGGMQHGTDTEPADAGP